MSTMTPKFQFLSVTEAAESLGITVSRVRQLLARGVIQGHKLGQKQWAIPPSEIERRRRENPGPGRPTYAT
jgi:excisionase family DNA binding protein